MDVQVRTDSVPGPVAVVESRLPEVHSSQRVEQGSKLVDRSGETLADIVDAVRHVPEIVVEIAAARAEQASGIRGRRRRALGQ